MIISKHQYELTNHSLIPNGIQTTCKKLVSKLKERWPNSYQKVNENAWNPPDKLKNHTKLIIFAKSSLLDLSHHCLCISQIR